MAVLASTLKTKAATIFAKNLASSNSVFITFGGNNATNTAATAVDSTSDIQTVLSEADGGVKLTASDIAVATSRQNWVANTAFARYDAFASTNCFVVVANGATSYVYKCLNNAGDGRSTVQPTGTSNLSFTTADGYRWKYAWRIDSQFSQFITATTVPVIADSNVTTTAVKSSVDTVVINNGGRGYNNYVSGAVQNGDVSGTSLRLNSTANTTNDFYNGCVLEITNPSSGGYGNTYIITDYVGSTKTVVASTPFVNIQVNDTYSIRPRVAVSGSANAAIISAVVNTSANSIASLVIHKAGSNYINAVATVTADNTVGVYANAVVTAHISPSYGHGGDVLSESDGSTVTIYKNIRGFAANTANTISTIAIVADPLYDNVAVACVGSQSKMTIGEEMLGWRLVGPSLGSVSVSSNTATGSNGAFTNIVAGDSIVVSNSSVAYVAVVATTTNSTSIQLASTYTITGTAGLISAINIGKLKTANSTVITLTDVPAGLNIPVKFVGGKTTRAYSNVTSITYPGGSSNVLYGAAHSNVNIVTNSGTVLYFNNYGVISTQTNNTISTNVNIVF